MTRRLIQIAKWGWLALLFGAVVLYILRNDITAQLQTVSPGRLVIAHGLLMAGKLLLVELSRQSVAAVDARMTYRRMFVINSLSQLAKYLPGGIWHYVGRAGYYHNDNLTASQITRAMLLENIWLVASASISGIIAYGLYRDETLLAAGLVVLWVALLALLYRRYGHGLPLAFYVLPLQAVTWVLLGLSFWVVLPAGTPALLAVGAFGLSWAIGFVTVFAPGGIGVREGMLTAILALVMPPAEALVYAAVNRVVWVISELLLGLSTRLINH